MNANYLCQTIGGLFAAFGVWYLWVALVSPVRQFLAGGREPADFLFLFGIVPLMAIPGVLALVFGIKLCRAVSLASLKWVMGLCACFGALWISSRLSSLAGEILPRQIQSGLSVLVGICVVVPVYVIVVGQLARRLGMGNLKTADLLSRGVLVLTAWQLWMVLFAVFQEYCPKDEEYPNVPTEAWDLVSLFAPPLIAYIAYRAAAARWLDHRPAEPGQAGGNETGSDAVKKDLPHTNTRL